MTSPYSLKAPHEPTRECDPVHCYSHMVDEVGAAYRVCGECFHLFPTKHALRRDRRANMAPIYLDELRTFLRHPAEARYWDQSPAHHAWMILRCLVSLATLRAKHIYSCPHCEHDF